MYNGYNMYGNMPPSVDRINAQISELERMRNQIQQQPQQPSINQTFQLAPNSTGLRFANGIDEVNKEFVINDTAFFSRDLSMLWVKNSKNEIRTFALTEIVPKDEKDLLIEQLQKQIEEMNVNAKSISNNVDEPIKNQKQQNVSSLRTSNAKQK